MASTSATVGRLAPGERIHQMLMRDFQRAGRQLRLDEVEEIERPRSRRSPRWPP